MDLTIMKDKKTMTSLEVVEQINIFRRLEGNKNPILHKNLLTIIRDEFEEEIAELKIKQTAFYRAGAMGSRIKTPMFELTLPQAKQILVRESKVVRKAVIKYIEELENKNKVPMNFEEAMLMAIRVHKEKELMLIENHKKDAVINDIVTVKDRYKATELVVELGYKSAVAMNKDLNSKGIIRKVNGCWLPTAKYSKQGLMDAKKVEFYNGQTGEFEYKFRSNGDYIFDYAWTPKGRKFLLELKND